MFTNTKRNSRAWRHSSQTQLHSSNNGPMTEANLHEIKAAVPETASADLVFSLQTAVPSGVSMVTDLAGKKSAAAAATTDMKKHALRTQQYLRLHDSYKDSSDENVVYIKNIIEDMDLGMKNSSKLAMIGDGAVETEER
ncbi:hypothetical protein K4K58_002018 [Colletotrichum sp. SAR11_239]|nr:hypothetical protein K4K58_002018 [Colletotrichum sp. SAR11_239]